MEDATATLSSTILQRKLDLNREQLTGQAYSFAIAVRFLTKGSAIHFCPRRIASTIAFLCLSWLLPSGGSAFAGDLGAKGCVDRDLDFGLNAVGWIPLQLSKLKRNTNYELAHDGNVPVLRATANASASAYAVHIKPPIPVPARIRWRWKTDAAVPGADNRIKDREDAPLRVIVGFDGDVSNLPAAEQRVFWRARVLSGLSLPYATLMYIWSEQIPAETVVPSAYTSQVKMLVVSSGTNGLGHWQSFARNLVDDYRHAFRTEPGRVLGVAVMTDTDNTGTQGVGEYADIRLTCTAE